MRNLITFALSALICLGCRGDDAIFAPPLDLETLYWDLRAPHNAVQLSTTAPYDTVQLTAIPLTPKGAIWISAGETAVDEGPTVWRSTDSVRVRVSSTGLVKALGATAGPVFVTAAKQVNNVTRMDSILVRVVADPAPSP